MTCVHHSNDKLHFQNVDPSQRFKCLSSPTINGTNNSVTFKWLSTNHTKEAGEVELNVSLLVTPVILGGDPHQDSHKNIGSSVSFVKHIGNESETHYTSLKIRKAIKLDEVLNTLQESVANFLESIFVLVFKVSGLESLIYRSELENASDEVGNTFYKEMMRQENSTFFKQIMSSSVFKPDDPTTTDQD